MENDETMIPDKDVSVFKTPKGINEDVREGPHRHAVHRHPPSMLR